MPVCSFCKKNFKEPRGLTLFTFEGKTIYFCSSKCRKNMALKRDPRKTNWVRKSGILSVSRNIAEENSLEKENNEK